ncbi:MAG: enoyl-CoA hydratase/isomerase family protein [Aeromicrobium sp.]
MTLPVYETLELTHPAPGVAQIMINRPEVLNSFNEQMRREFSAVWADLRGDDDVRAIVLTAAGDRAFSTGLDVTERTADTDSPWVDTDDPWRESEDPGRQLGPKSNEVWKPVIAAVKGMCAGGAFYWIGECDIVLGTPESTYFDPHVTYGMVAALEPISLSYKMNYGDVVRMAIMGLHERVTAETARQAGLVSEIVDGDQIVERAVSLAATIATQPAAAVQGTVKALWQSRDLGRAQAMATALMYTQVGNPIGAANLDRAAAKPAKWAPR